MNHYRTLITYEIMHSDRVLTLDRTYVKAILNSIGLLQAVKSIGLNQLQEIFRTVSFHISSLFLSAPEHCPVSPHPPHTFRGSLPLPH